MEGFKFHTFVPYSTSNTSVVKGGLIIYLLICNSIYTPLVRHPVQSEWEKLL